MLRIGVLISVIARSGAWSTRLDTRPVVPGPRTSRSGPGASGSGACEADRDVDHPAAGNTVERDLDRYDLRIQHVHGVPGVRGPVVEQVAHLVVEGLSRARLGELEVHGIGQDVDREVVRLGDVEDVGRRGYRDLEIGLRELDAADRRRHRAGDLPGDGNRIDDLGGEHLARDERDDLRELPAHLRGQENLQEAHGHLQQPLQEGGLIEQRPQERLDPLGHDASPQAHDQLG